MLKGQFRELKIKHKSRLCSPGLCHTVFFIILWIQTGNLHDRSLPALAFKVCRIILDFRADVAGNIHRSRAMRPKRSIFEQSFLAIGSIFVCFLWFLSS